MTRNEAQTQIRGLAAHRGRIRFLRHALIRSPGEGKHPISERQAADCLRLGFVDEGPVPDIKLTGGSKFRCSRSAGDVVTVVAGVLVPGRMVVVITGYEDYAVRRRAWPGFGEWEEGDED